MVRTNDVFDMIGLGWFALLFFGGVGLLIGVADGHIHPSRIPGGVATVAGGFVGVAAVTSLAQQFAQNRFWVRAGKQAGLTPDGLSLRGEPVLSGEIRDRPVQVRSYAETYGSGENKQTQAYTSVETILSTSLKEGVVVSPEIQRPDGIQFNTFSGSTDAVSEERGIEVTGKHDDAFLEAIDETGAADVVDDITYFGTFHVGDTGAATAGAIPDSMMERLDNATDDEISENLQRGDGDALTVTHVTEGTLYDADDMQAQVEAVVALAEAAESMDTAKNT